MIKKGTFRFSGIHNWNHWRYRFRNFSIFEKGLYRINKALFLGIVLPVTQKLLRDLFNPRSLVWKVIYKLMLQKRDVQKSPQNKKREIKTTYTIIDEKTL